jgi:hypothetical protein
VEAENQNLINKTKKGKRLYFQQIEIKTQLHSKIKTLTISQNHNCIPKSKNKKKKSKKRKQKQIQWTPKRKGIRDSN